MFTYSDVTTTKRINGVMMNRTDFKIAEDGMSDQLLKSRKAKWTNTYVCELCRTHEGNELTPKSSAVMLSEYAKLLNGKTRLSYDEAGIIDNGIYRRISASLTSS